MFRTRACSAAPVSDRLFARLSAAGVAAVLVGTLTNTAEENGPKEYLGEDPGSNTPGVQLMEGVFTSGGWHVVTLETLEM